MKAEGRTVLVCHKELPNGIVDRFEVVVPTKIKDQAIANYKSQGYNVRG